MADNIKKLDAESKNSSGKLSNKELKNERKSARIDSRPFAEISSLKVQRRSKKRKRINRSIGGDLILFLFLALAGVLSALPLILTINNAFKPLDELFKFPPNIFVRNPTLANFSDLGVALSSSIVPFSRYLFNTILITIVGTVGHVIVASMCAYPLAKYKIPGGTFIFGLVIYSLMFPAAVTAIPNYIILNWLGMIDTYWALILPMVASSLGLFLMKQFMGQISTSYIESAKIDGAGDFKIFWKIVMPLVKPAWITLIILVFQSLWNANGAMYIYREDFKMVSYALSQIATAGPARQGTLAAVGLLMISVPIIMFIVSQSNMLETMAHSGIKE
ncbi:MAG: carbohydrate ABC transporter permease [Bacilli bacterium]|jgi:ABC-type glycerol-3-phosphate transport system permease component|nr:carbohydrate ABC transporter permease [Bacilli bacterium]MDD2681534.1 carbohydrate ABC transporter permease [Bacilli bacterium]MDD3121067.1 carbohydrate ABC transporter permease [Bacilli bacterium]MDD4063758.1 carbohydrate ABC transporter permease [Bacilli bacterium]MDD4481881.1 carbohydrate ABC transporter permease [Bacilli bacterium]